MSRRPKSREITQHLEEPGSRQQRRKSGGKNSSQLTRRSQSKRSRPRRSLSRTSAETIHGIVREDLGEVTQGCHPLFAKAFNYLILLLIVFIVYDVTTQYTIKEAAIVRNTARYSGKLTSDLVRVATTAGEDLAVAVTSSKVGAVCFTPNVVGPNSPTYLKELVQSQTLQPLVDELNRRLYDLGMKFKDVPLLYPVIEGTRQKLISNGEKPPPVDLDGRLPIENPSQKQLLLDSKSVAKVEEPLTIGFVRGMKDWVSDLSGTVTGDIEKSVNICSSYNMDLHKIKRNTEIRLRLAIDAYEAEIGMISDEVIMMGENAKMALWRVIILAGVLKLAASLISLIIPSSRTSGGALEDRRPELEFAQLNFRMRKSRKRKSAKRKASRKVSRKRKSVKRKVSRKRKSVKRKVSRKRKSVKRKASRKRKSAKRKASRKRKSAKRKASRKRKSAKMKSRKRKSAKRKASRKRKRCPPGCVKRR